MDEARARQRLDEQRERVEQALERLRSETGEVRARESAGELGDYDQHQADQGTDTYDRAAALGRIADLEEELRAIERAERRLEEGTYGRSVESGAPIPEERLRAVPTAERTVEEEARHRRAAAPPGADDDVATPLDEEDAPPADLSRIPMAAEEAGPGVDPQEEDDEVALKEMPGEAYPGEGGAPRVGEPEPDDAAVERRYRPEG